MTHLTDSPTAQAKARPKTPRSRAVLAAVLLTAGALVVIWFAAVPLGPIACPTIDPPLPNCLRQNREGTALVATVIVLMVGVTATLLAAFTDRRQPVVVAVTLLAIAPVVAWLVIGQMPGFRLESATSEPPQAPSPAPVAATEQSTGDPVGTWGTVVNGSASIVVAADQTFGGTDGCNGFSGRWEQPSPTEPIVFTDTVTSLVMCEDLGAWLSAGRSALVNGDSLYVLDENGSVLDVLERTS